MCTRPSHCREPPPRRPPSEARRRSGGLDGRPRRAAGAVAGPEAPGRIGSAPGRATAQSSQRDTRRSRSGRPRPRRHCPTPAVLWRHRPPTTRAPESRTHRGCTCTKAPRTLHTRCMRPCTWRRRGCTRAAQMRSSGREARSRASGGEASRKRIAHAGSRCVVGSWAFRPSLPSFAGASLGRQRADTLAS